MKEARWREALLEMMGARGGPDWVRAGAAAILLDRISRAKDALGAAMWTLWACVVFSFAAALPAWWMFTMWSAALSARGVGLGTLILGWIVLWAFCAFRAVDMAKFTFGGKAAAALAALPGACACAGFAWVLASLGSPRGPLSFSLHVWPRTVFGAGPRSGNQPSISRFRLTILHWPALH